ncbi:hypothetical protein CFBP8129_16990 [Xanthomonas hortorum pv. gardneri]|uniref:Uncharacterized protein n=1 Tax=Xanthomonas hortorum pv. gardneri TaxID=2754056 RepID=A0A6V7CWI1_9XANT|nr:hypothetical protein CFBP8129_16990 [Xanthomonas hortorum pv. gardneri]CAD0322516.1 hypothetical protein CFBP8129_16990 [Xanthomonas hortorum pv. gardneri]
MTRVGKQRTAGLWHIHGSGSLLGRVLRQCLAQGRLRLVAHNAIYLQTTFALKLLDRIFCVAAEIAISVQGLAIAANSAKLSKLALKLLHLLAALALP